MSEARTPQPEEKEVSENLENLTLSDAADKGAALVDEYDAFTSEVQRKRRSDNGLDRVEATSSATNIKRDNMIERMKGLTSAVALRTGVDPTLADRPNTYESNLALAVLVGREAEAAEFSLDREPEGLKEQAQRLMDGYDKHVGDREEDRGIKDRDDTGKAKRLLIESTARELARKLDSKNPYLTHETVKFLEENSGIDFTGYVREVRHLEYANLHGWGKLLDNRTYPQAE